MSEKFLPPFHARAVESSYNEKYARNGHVDDHGFLLETESYHTNALERKELIGRGLVALCSVESVSANRMS